MTDFRLRTIEKEDLPVIWKWRNAEHIRKHMYNEKVIPWEDHVDWFEHDQKNPSSVSKLFLHKDRPLGVVRFTNINEENGTCEWGFYIGDPDAPKGSGTTMGRLALDYIFENYDLRKVCAEVLSVNEASVRYHRKLGFVQEGCLRHQLKREEELVDVILMGLFKKKWMAARDALARRWGNGNQSPGA